MKKRSLVLGAMVLLVGVNVSAARADLFTFFGEDQGLGEGTPLPAESWANALAAQSSFLDNLIGVGTESFEGAPDGTGTPLNINFGAAGTATMVGTGAVNVVPAGSTNGNGRYATDGTHYWESGFTFGIDFSQPISAFGFMGIDIGDFDGQVILTLANGGTKDVNIGNSINIAGGSVLYFAVIEDDAADAFTSITFTNTAESVDFFGFDELTIGTLEQVDPEGPRVIPVPGAALLGMMGLGMVGWIRRKTA